VRRTTDPVVDSSSRPSSIEELKAELKKPRRKRSARRISTRSLENALDQILRARKSGTKASVKATFVARAFKELIRYRREEKRLLREVDQILSEDVSCVHLASDSIHVEGLPKIVVDEVTSLSQLGDSSWESGTDLRDIEWKLPADQDDLEDDEDEDDEDELDYASKTKSALTGGRTGLRTRSRWNDNSSTRRFIIYALLAVIMICFGSMLL
jgi:hypothetical protein